MVNDGRNPETCKASYNFRGTWICELEVVECERVKKCPRVRIHEMILEIEKEIKHEDNG